MIFEMCATSTEDLYRDLMNTVGYDDDQWDDLYDMLEEKMFEIVDELERARLEKKIKKTAN